MKKLSLLMILLCLGLTSRGQGNGYLGKHVLGGYALQFSPFLDYGLGADIKPDFGLRHNLVLDCIVAPKSMAGIEFGYLPTRLPFSDSSGTYRASVNSTFIGVTFTTYGQFRGSVLAPVGDYLRFKAFMNNITLKDPEGRTASSANTAGPAVTRSASFFGIGLGYGHTLVSGDVVVLDVGAELDIIAGVNINPRYNQTNSRPEFLMINAVSGLTSLTVRVGLSGLFF